MLSVDKSWSTAFIAQATAGGIAGATATFLSNPLDVVKTRLQSHPGHRVNGISAGAITDERYRGALDGLRHMIKEEGYIAFTRGLPTRVVQRVPTAAFGAIILELVTLTINHIT
jgi:hypothetical protein